eukprot:s6863_g2.t1
MLPIMSRAPFHDEEAEAVKLAAQQQPSDDESDIGDDVLQQLELREKQEVPRTPSNKATPPASLQVPQRAPMVEERGQKRPAEGEPEMPSQAGSSMEDAETRKRGIREDDDVQADERQSQVPRSEPTSPSHLYPPAFAGTVGRVEQEGEMCVATVHEPGDEYLFGAQDEDEECERQFGEDRDELVQFFWDNEDMEHEPVVSPEQLATLDEEAFQEEVTRLLSMGVLKVGKEKDLTEDYLELSTTSVQDWRHRGSWKRRARLVAREYKWSDPTRQDLFSSATSSSQVRLLGAIMMTDKKFQLWSIDVRDAFLQVPQKRPTFVRPPKGYGGMLGTGEVWTLERLLPGQRAGTKEWSLYLQDILKGEEYEALPLSPNLYVKRNAQGETQGIILAHVDDIQLAATPEEGQRLRENLNKKFTLTIQGPCGPGSKEEAVQFLKRRYEYTEEGLTIVMGEKYIEKLVKLLGLEQKRDRATPETIQEEDDPPELEGEERQRFATAVGILLYMSGDRPDAQHGIRELASALTKPTKAKYRQLEQLVCYLKGTSGYSLHLKWTRIGRSALEPGEHLDDVAGEGKEDLLEVLTGSDWAGNKKTRKSVGVAHFYYNGNLVYTLTRTQKSIALSSCEAEYVAMTTGASEAVFLKNCLEFATGRRCRIVLRCDSSSARSFCHRQRVGRVRHISCGLLWLQELVQNGSVEVKPIGTWRNTSDISTKVQSKRRLKILLNLMGYVDRHKNYEPVGEMERCEDEQRELEKKAVQRIKRGNVQVLYRAFRTVLVQSVLEQGLGATTGLGSCGTDQSQGEESHGTWTRIILIMVVLKFIILAAILARWIYKRLRNAQNTLEQRLMVIETTIQALHVEQAERGARLDGSVNTLLQNTAALVMNVRGVRTDAQRLLEELAQVSRQPSSHSEPNEGVLRISANIPGLREDLIAQLGDRVVLETRSDLENEEESVESTWGTDHVGCR